MNYKNIYIGVAVGGIIAATYTISHIYHTNVCIKNILSAAKLGCQYFICCTLISIITCTFIDTVNLFLKL